MREAVSGSVLEVVKRCGKDGKFTCGYCGAGREMLNMYTWKSSLHCLLATGKR